MDAEYLKANVGEVLANGLTAVVLNQPEDSVDYLARWLLKCVENTKSEDQLKETLRKQNEADKKQEEIENAEKSKKDKQEEDKASAIAFKKKEFEAFLVNAASFEGLYEGFVKHLQDILDVTGVYIGLKEDGVVPAEPAAPVEETDEGDETPASSSLTLQYIAANADHQHMVGKRLRGTQGVTFDVFKDTPQGDAAGDEGDAEEDGEEDGEGTKKVAEPVDEGPKTLHIPNVLMGPGAEKMHYWTLPKLGSYVSVRMKFDGCLNEKTLDQAIDKEETLLEQKQREEDEAKNKEAVEGEGEGEENADEGGEEADANEGDKEEKKEGDGEGEGEEQKEEEDVKEESEEEKTNREMAEAAAKAAADEIYLISHLEKQDIDLAICADTLSTGKRFTEEQIVYMRQMVTTLNESVLRIDRMLFKEERIRRQELVKFNETVEDKTEEEVQAELERLKANLERAGTTLTTDIDVAFKYRQNAVTALRERYVSFRTFNVFRGNLDILQALMFLMDFKKEDVSDIDGKPSWLKIRSQLDDDFLNKLQAYDPREPQIRDKNTQYATVSNLRKMVAACDMDEVKAKNRPLAELLGYIQDALAVKKQARFERKESRRQAEEEAARIAAEEAAAAEEAKAAEEAEAGEGDEPAEGDAEEKKDDVDPEAAEEEEN